MKRQRDDHALAALMQAAQGGDTQAFVLLLKEITPRLRQIVRGQRRFLKIEDIEDLVQDILLSLHAVGPPTIRDARCQPTFGHSARSVSRSSISGGAR
jgi:hypothetical protein